MVATWPCQWPGLPAAMVEYIQICQQVNLKVNDLPLEGLLFFCPCRRRLRARGGCASLDLSAHWHPQIADKLAYLSYQCMFTQWKIADWT